MMKITMIARHRNMVVSLNPSSMVQIQLYSCLKPLDNVGMHTESQHPTLHLFVWFCEAHVQICERGWNTHFFAQGTPLLKIVCLELCKHKYNELDIPHVLFRGIN